MQGALDAPSVDIDPFSTEFLSDPYAVHGALRDAAPVFWLARYGIWGAARHGEVQQALQDWETFSSAAGVGLSDFRKETPWRTPSIILEADPPLHSRTRPVLAQALSPATLKDLRPTFVAEAEKLVDRLIAQRRFDGVTDLAEVYPIHVFADALGLPEQGREHLLPYAAMTFNAFGPRNGLFEETFEASIAARAWVGEQCRREALAPGSIGAAVFAAADRGEVSEEEAGLLVRSLLSAGLDTTVHGLANSLYCFATNPDQFALLRADHARARNAFEEVMRFESPVQTFFRTTTRATELGGVRLEEGQKILLFLAAANRDPRRWGEDSEAFKIERKAGGNVAFGTGIHGCVGQMVARMEAEIVLTALAERVSTIRLAGPATRRLNNTLHGFAHLPLEAA